MQRLNSIQTARAAITLARAEGKRIALVPTMGNLHLGHLSLIKEAHKNADFVIASIFVNPLQFGPNEDFERYPRTLESDCDKLESCQCNAVFLPDVSMLYPYGQQHVTTVRVPVVSEGLCAASRPNHFDGVSTVVNILFNIVNPDVALFGKKDYQQLAVIRKMVADLHIPIEIIGVDTVREENGLALSSRNGYLDADQHSHAPLLAQRLNEAAQQIRAGEKTEEVLVHTRQKLQSDGFQIDYLELRNLDLSPLGPQTDNGILLAAVYLGNTRLIDNLQINIALE